MDQRAPDVFALTPLGGPSVLIEYGPLRLLVDPTFGPAGDYPVGSRVLVKTSDARYQPSDLGPVDVVLLSHDQHPDNLDTAGREYVRTAPLVLTTTLAAGRLDAPCQGLELWEKHELRGVTITAVPAQHGPDGCEPLTGPVIGFVLTAPGAPTLYVSGDNASLDVVRRIAAGPWSIDAAVLFAGAARTPLLEGTLTLTAQEASDAAEILGHPVVLPVHATEWAHFTEDLAAVAGAFEQAGRSELLLSGVAGDRASLPR